jgi:hypothetical protein
VSEIRGSGHTAPPVVKFGEYTKGASMGSTDSANTQ